MKKITIVNKNKFVKSILILILVLSSIILILNNKSYSTSEQKYKTEYIVKGETLWNIAKREAEKNQYFKNEDIRNVILEIKKVNNMNTSDVSEGMKIKIPIY